MTKRYHQMHNTSEYRVNWINKKKTTKIILIETKNKENGHEEERQERSQIQQKCK